MKTFSLLVFGLLSLSAMAQDNNQLCIHLDSEGWTCFRDGTDESSQLTISWGARGLREACFSGSPTEVAAMVQSAFKAAQLTDIGRESILVEGYDAGTLWVEWTDETAHVHTIGTCQ